MNEKILIFGLDGLGWDLFRRLIKENAFSNIHDEIKHGYQNKLYTTVPTVTYTALPSFMTGKNPLNIPEGYVLNQMILRDFSKTKDKVFWESRKLKSCIVNLRCTYKPKKFNGKMIAGDLYTPSEDSIYTYPEELKGEVTGFHKNIKMLHNPDSLEEYFKILKDDTKNKLKIFKKLVFEENFDLSLFWDGNMDLLLHYRWGRWKEIKDYISMMDKNIGEIFKKTNAKNVFLLSDHGFDCKHKYDFYLNTWLKNKSYLKLKKLYRFGKVNEFIYRWAIKNKKIGRIVSKYTANKEKDNHDFSFSRSYPGVNYSETVAQAPKGFWGVELNSNILDKDEYEKVRLKIMSDLRRITHEGNTVFKNIWTSEDLYGTSTYGKKATDIFFVTNPKYKCVPPIGDKMFSKPVMTEERSKRQGGHTNSPEAFFVAFGNDIKMGDSNGKIKIFDIAPTILHYFDTSIPEDMDGRVLKEIFKKESEPYQKAIRYSSSSEKEKLDSIIKNLKI